MSGLTLVPKVADSLLKGLDSWRGRKAEAIAEKEKRATAINEVMQAVIVTKAYLYDLHATEKPSRKREIELSKKWQKAAAAIHDYDFELFQSSRVKSLGWADPREWKRASINPDKIKLDAIILQCEWLLSNES